MYEYVVVDTPHTLRTRMMTGDGSVGLHLPGDVGNFSSLRATLKVLGLLRELGYSPDKVKVVVNRVGRADRIDLKAT